MNHRSASNRASTATTRNNSEPLNVQNAINAAATSIALEMRILITSQMLKELDT